MNYLPPQTAMSYIYHDDREAEEERFRVYPVPHEKYFTSLTWC